MAHQIVKRDDLRRVARERLREARALHVAGLHAGAYHLSGFAVECALKAVIAHRVERYTFPSKAFAIDCHVHKLEKLLGLAGLSAELDTASAQVRTSWAVVKDWDNEARYDHNLSLTTARDLYRAVTRRHGVMQWLRERW